MDSVMSLSGDQSIVRKLKLDSWKSHAMTFTVGMLALIGIPYIHIGIIHRWFWVPGKVGKVDKGTCTCSCFDTIFRGSYERGVTGYKNVYFNATAGSLQIWALIVGSLLISYEVIRYLIKVLRKGAVRWTWFFLFAASVYPHYYSVWNYFNYINERFYSQWYHQLLFSTTEIISTAVDLNLCNKNQAVTSRKVLMVFSINFMHVVVAGIDQFVANVFLGRGYAFQVFRDIGMTPPDVLHIVVCLIEMYRISKMHGPGMGTGSIIRDLPYAGAFMALFFIVSKML
ncbi:uncharacterized protein LOC106157996 [Lingula anatina]|uniref:Uncharacterized protein LOC106157996 n=1 Tax=Lingula anatina TaxID=7574 RepID=A0A1S3HTC1_LINAN|nr:uncharacterized protein LOC106157996 [Lingula anatina]XP_013389290.1 uncharacterized protein LOC106157996 [Lingula anatina]|eukprot:XP_013389281.1 uncharacterized protein LOC106157996 [Lingula anatina]